VNHLLPQSSAEPSNATRGAEADQPTPQNAARERKPMPQHAEKRLVLLDWLEEVDKPLMLEWIVTREGCAHQAR
jgi:hypothetical protein